MAARFVFKANPQIEADRRLLQFDCYEDYLDSLGTNQDECYLQSIEVSRTIAELGYRSSGETLSKKQFETRLAAVLNYLFPPYNPYELSSEGLTGHDNLQVDLALRERPNRVGILSTIIFLKYMTKSGFEVSGYIDYAEKLGNEDWKPFFKGKKRVVPKPSDLGYYHWKSGRVVCNDSLNYKVQQDPNKGLIFQNRFDRKMINPAPGVDPGANTTRKRIYTNMYELVIVFDHLVRQRI
ncbi:cilia- and flagella-associated protein 299-like isoform X1 [Diabrotica virgifera virgifera]|uniref:Cilia- and flagella-associated protein 299 n=1 Tax=Diabrotica virgifera virgifera TaxID=50390 RepID=A0ABM5JTD4_DIAVI|nr:cilia- and flagella-associated protein 299-like isoform X1 [Diabrotica virgifera virgifera]